jgi:hypothetical protein
MPQYILRDLPAELWNKVKDRAQQEGWPLRALFLRLLAEYAIGRLTLGSPPSATASASLQSLRPVPATGPFPVIESRAFSALIAAHQTRPALRAVVVKLHDGDRQVRIPEVIDAQEQDQDLVLYGPEHRSLGRFARTDVKSWWFEEPT